MSGEKSDWKQISTGDQTEVSDCAIAGQEWQTFLKISYKWWYLVFFKNSDAQTESTGLWWPLKSLYDLIISLVSTPLYLLRSRASCLMLNPEKNSSPYENANSLAQEDFLPIPA